MRTRPYPVGTVLIEKIGSDLTPPRAVIVVECPELYAGPLFDLGDRQWGYYLEVHGFGGPWHGHPDGHEPHPDPDSVWAKWAEWCASELTK